MDAVAETAHKLIGAVKQAGSAPRGGMMGIMPAEMLSMVEPLIDPAKEALKSVERVAFAAIKAGKSVRAEEVLNYYRERMSGRGWSLLATVRGNGGGLLLMAAPEGKGVFGVFPEGQQVVVGLMTTSAPVGDLLGQIVRAGAEPLLKMLPMAMKVGAAFRAPPEPLALLVKPTSPPAAKKPVKSGGK